MQYKCKYTCTYIAVFFHSDCIQHIPRESCKRELPKYIDISFLELKYLKHYIFEKSALNNWSPWSPHCFSIDSPDSPDSPWGKIPQAPAPQALQVPPSETTMVKKDIVVPRKKAPRLFFSRRTCWKIMWKSCENHGTEINRTFTGKYG